MRGVGAAAGRSGWLGRAAAAGLVAAAAAATITAVRLGEAAGGGGDDLLAELRSRTARRVASEREQIRPVLEAVARGEIAAARNEAETALGRLGGNSQLHLLLAGLYRESGAAAPALREYRRAVELVRDYADRRAPQYIGAALAPWMSEVRPALAGVARADLHYLERALAGGCS
jgi:hypothetical protein